MKDRSKGASPRRSNKWREVWVVENGGTPLLSLVGATPSAFSRIQIDNGEHEAALRDGNEVVRYVPARSKR